MAHGRLRGQIWKWKSGNEYPSARDYQPATQSVAPTLKAVESPVVMLGEVCSLSPLIIGEEYASLPQNVPSTSTSQRLPVSTADSTDQNQNFAERFRSTVVPVFLLLTLYLCNPGSVLCGPDISRVDADLFRFLLRFDRKQTDLTLTELYKASRLSGSRFWGESYHAHLDDLENLPPLTLYHKAHVIQFKMSELFDQRRKSGMGFSSPLYFKSLQHIVDELIVIADISSSKSHE